MLDQDYSCDSLTQRSLGYPGLSIFSDSANSGLSDSFKNSCSHSPNLENLSTNSATPLKNVTPARGNVYQTQYTNISHVQTNRSNTTQLAEDQTNNLKRESTEYRESVVDVNKILSTINGKLFWLEPNEISGLIPVPHITNQQVQLNTKSYIVFTPQSLDIEVFGELPNGSRPFAVVYSYCYDTYHFQVRQLSKKFGLYKNENTGNSYSFYLANTSDNDDSTPLNSVCISFPESKPQKPSKISDSAPKAKTKNLMYKKSQHNGPHLNSWVYEESNLDTEIDPLWNVPRALVREVKLITGINTKTNILRADVSTANHRLNAMLNRSYAIEQSQDNEHSNSSPVVKVKFESDYFGYDDEDVVRVFDDDQLKASLQLMLNISMNQQPNLSVINLAQYCPNIFWNLAFKGNVEDRLKELSPEVYNMCSKRRRRGASFVTSNESTTNSNNKLNNSNTLNRLHYDTTIDNTFDIMQNIYKLDAEAKIKNLEELKATANIARHKPLIDLDDEEIVEAVIDKSGVMKLCISSLNEHQRRLVYAECLARNYFPPVYLIHSASKGRGVEAAYDIQKDDFVMEYKGELVTEKEARERDKEYNLKQCFGSFVFYFKHDGRHYSIDSTKEYIQYGAARLINHSRKKPNLLPKTLYVDGIPRLFFVAKRLINKGEELLVDYGERDPDAIRENPWLEDS